MINCIKCKTEITVHESHKTPDGNVCNTCKIAELEAQLAEYECECEWKLVSDGPDFDEFYETTCGSAFSFTDGTWHENDYRHCPKCGLPIKESEAKDE